MNKNRKTILVLFAVLIALELSGCVEKISDYGIETPGVTPQVGPTPIPSPAPDVSVSPAIKGYGFSIYGKLLDYAEEEKLVTLKINQKIKDCEKNTSFVELTANSTGLLLIFDLIRGKNYAFYFFKENEEDMWELHRIEEELDKESCIHLHENDMRFHFQRKEVKPLPNESERYVRLIPLIIKEGEISYVKVNITNKQDIQLQYDLSTSVHEYYTLSPSSRVKKPSFEERLNESQVDYCKLIYDKTGSVEANSHEVVDIGVMCETADETRNKTGNYVIYLILTFVDELGNVHKVTGDYYTETFCVNNCIVSEYKYGVQTTHTEEPVMPSPAPIHHETETTVPAPSSLMEVKLAISDAPALNETAELTCSITSVLDAYNTTARIELPEGFELVSGSLSWNGDIIVPEEAKLKHPRPNISDPEHDRLCEEYTPPEGRVKFSAVVKSVRVGNWTIRALAKCIMSDDSWFGGGDNLYSSVFEDKATVSNRPPLAKNWTSSKRCVVVKESEIFPRMQTPSKMIYTEKPVEHAEVNLRPISNFTGKNPTRQVAIIPIQNFTAESQNRVKNRTQESTVRSIPSVTPTNQNSSNLFSTQGNVTTRSTVTVFSEDFEGTFPGDNWLAADSNPDSGEDYWDDTSYREYGGNWSGYCADIGDTGSNHKYDNNMYAYMLRKYLIDASDWDSATLSYYSWYEIESGYDYLRVIVTGDGGSNWYEIGDKYDGNSGGWGYHSVSVPAEYLTSQLSIGFLFYSDSSVTYEGAYVDDIELEAEVPTPGDITIKGYFYYYDIDNILQPAFGVTVEAYDDDLGSPTYLGNDLTDSNGYYEIGQISNDDGFGQGGLDVYVRFLASTSARRVNDANDNVYDGFSNITPNVPDGDVWIENLRPPDGEERAWWIYYTLYDGWNYVANEVSPGYVMPLQIVCWQDGHDADYGCGVQGSHYHPGGQIHLDGRQGAGPAGGHANDPDVILHEYGHAVMYRIYGDWFPETHCPSPHFINWHSHVNCSWTEGWANFFPLAVLTDEFFTDTTGDWEVNLETRNGGIVFADGDDVEGNVAAALWDIFDEHNDSYDEFWDGFDNIWDVVSHQTDDNFAEFYAAWDARGHDVSNANAAIYQNTIDYNDEPDVILASPNGGGWYCCIITVEAMAVDQDGTVSQVEFNYSLDSTNGVDGTWNPIGVDTSPAGGWSIDWNTSGISDPTVWVKARAWDNLGESSEWDPSDASFGVDNTVPPVPTTSSPSHLDEDEWYSDDDPLFTWTTLPDTSGIACYSYSLDQSDTTTPDTTCDTTENNVWYSNVPDGIWYFHVKAKDNAGNWGGADYYRVKIDTAYPTGWQNFAPTDWVADQTPDCTIEVKDVTAGLDVSAAYYQYSNNSGSTWSSWLSANCTGSDGTTSYQTITAGSVPFNQNSETQNRIKFKIDDMVVNTGESGEYTVKIDATDPPVAIPKSDHKYNNAGSKYYSPTYLNGSQSYDPDGYTTEYKWDFGDGDVEYGEMVEHIYSTYRWIGDSSGHYEPFDVNLTVKDDEGNSDTSSTDVNVYTAGDANGDGEVDILDATIVGLEWGATTTCEAYCWEGDERGDKADLNNDCNVNILDAVIIGKCWGHTAW